MKINTWIKNIYQIVLLIFILTLIPVSGNAEGTPKVGFLNRDQVIKTAATLDRKKYPNADSILVDDYEKISYNPDGTGISRDEVYEKILTEKGRRENRTLTFYYTLPYSTVKVELLEIIKPDGKIIKVDVPANSREMVNRSQMSSNIYNPNSKLLQVTIPNQENPRQTIFS